MRDQGGVRALGIEAGLTSRAAATSAIDDIVRQLGRIDIAVCNAGGGTVVFADERPSSPGANETGDAVTSGTPSDCPEEMYSLMRGKSGSGGHTSRCSGAELP
jgi:NAD(P)-dependent dehydrogenase (short-subunit alcohol dehydrogenase family)